MVKKKETGIIELELRKLLIEMLDELKAIHTLLQKQNTEWISERAPDD